MSDHPPAPFFRAWVIYILAFVAVSIPVRLSIGWFAGHFWEDAGVDPARLELGAQMLAGVLLLPASFVLYRWSVRRLMLQVG